MNTAPSLSLIATPKEKRQAFADLDERIVDALPGVVLVRAPLKVQAALLAHMVRRLRTSGFVTIDVAAHSRAPLFREVATLLGLPALPNDSTAFAETLASVVVERRVAILVPRPRAGSWDRVVVAELARGGRALVVLLGLPAEEVPTFVTDENAFELTGELNGNDRLRWLSALAEEAEQGLDLCGLEAWWTKSDRMGRGAGSLDAVGEAGHTLLTILALAGRSVPERSLATLGPNALGALLACGLARRTGQSISLCPSCDVAAIDERARDAEVLAAARLLMETAAGWEPDAWAIAQAAELFVRAAEFEQADGCIAAALRGARDVDANSEIVGRWHAVVAPVKGASGFMLRVRAAERALAAGEASDALRWCEGAAALESDHPTVMLLMSRALILLGDLVTARALLARAEAVAAGQEGRARAAAELAELDYLAGDHDAAAAHAKRAIELAESLATRFAGRSTLGKLLLAAGRWDEADAHFANDALTLSLSASGEPAAELRARLNRSIAIMSKGLLDEARPMLEAVLDDGTRFGEERACAFALTNLAVLAYRQHEYGKALSYWDRASRYPAALRGRMLTAWTIANLAGLRLRLGLVEQADHAVIFGRRLLAGSADPACVAHFKRISAQIALARRNSDLARREIDRAIVDAQASRNRECLDHTLNVAVRVALEDGDLERASRLLEQAEPAAASIRARAETAILRTHLLRALGHGALETADGAVSLARDAGDEDLLAEIYGLLATLHRSSGNLEAARTHCGRALALRDEVADGLPPDVRVAFLAKPDIVALARLHASLAEARITEEAAPQSSERESPRANASDRELMGDDPQIRALHASIRRVARTNATVLIYGESGTGKELVAEALHRASERARGPMVSVNCAALVETLLLSELFGHEKGAFTGATNRRRGRFELAEGGTLFLDEIGDISPRTQVALLRVLQEKTFERVGGAVPIRANVRVLCATHRDLRAMVARGQFREDLYYRLGGITLEVPALRTHIGDLPKMAEHLLQRVAGERGESAKRLAPDATALLLRHRWPGNVRELENVLRSASLFADGDVIGATDILEHVEGLRSVARSQSSLPPPASADDDTGELPSGEASATAVVFAHVRGGVASLTDMKRHIERDCIVRALSETGGNITRAALLLGMKRPRVSQLVKQYGLANGVRETIT